MNTKKNNSNLRSYNTDLFPHGRILVCPPPFFDVKYEINAWMSLANTPDKKASLLQWRELQHTLLRLGANLEYLNPDKAVPDLVFTANAGLIKGNTVVPSKFRYPQRQLEEPINEKWFSEQGYEIKKVTKGFFEGEGDALYAGEKLFIGYEFRTEKKVISEVAALLNVKDVIACEMTDPYFYHLDTCFSPLNESFALIHKDAFTKDTFKKIEKELELLVVPEEEAKKFVCNAVVLGNNVIIPKDCPITESLLAKKGYKAYPVQLTEFLKGGGSAKCLTLFLDRD